MRKEYVLVKVFCLLFINAWSQNFDWAKAEGLWAYDYGYGVTTDNSGNVYMTGKYEENSIFSDTTVGCKGNHDIFVTKYSPSGELLWATTAGGVLGDYGTCVTTDNSYLYVGGEIEGYGVDVYFSNSPIVLHCEGHNDIFVAKYDLNGNVLWAKRAGAFKNEKALGIATNGAGDVYIAGFFNDSAIFDNHLLLGNGKNDIFIAKYDADGNCLWARNAGSAQRDEAKAIKCDAQGNVYITGLFSETITMGSYTLTSPNGYFDMFIAKYDPNGNVLWAKRAGSDYDEVGWGIEIDNAGKIYVGGEFNAYATFDNIAMTTTGEANVFVACYDNAGNAQWVSQAGGNGIDRARAIGCDGNNVYITGQFGLSAYFGTTTLNAADSSDIFVAALNNTGSFIWAVAVGGGADSLEDLGYESGCAITAHSSGAVYASGALLDGGIFGSHSVEGYKRTDIFLTRISQVGTNVELVTKQKRTLVYPNPAMGSFTVDLKNFATDNIETVVYNCMGQAVDRRTDISASSVNFDLSNYDKGIYFVEVRAGDKIMREKVMLQK
jgi:hypothetical protein